MNIDPVPHTHEVVSHEVVTHEVVPAYEREVLVRDDSAAVSSVTLTMLGIIVAVALIAVVVAVATWGGGSNGRTNITPGQGGGDTAPAPSQNAPSREQNPTQPQIVPTTITLPR